MKNAGLYKPNHTKVAKAEEQRIDAQERRLRTFARIEDTYAYQVMAAAIKREMQAEDRNINDLIRIDRAEQKRAKRRARK